MWSRKPTIIGGRAAPDDVTVLRNGQTVGRVHRSPLTGVAPFCWFTWSYPSARGYADTLEDGLRQVRQAIRAQWPDDVPRVPKGIPE